MSSSTWHNVSNTIDVKIVVVGRIHSFQQHPSDTIQLGGHSRRQSPHPASAWRQLESESIHLLDSGSGRHAVRIRHYHACFRVDPAAPSSWVGIQDGNMVWVAASARVDGWKLSSKRRSQRPTGNEQQLPSKSIGAIAWLSFIRFVLRS